MEIIDILVNKRLLSEIIEDQKGLPLPEVMVHRETLNHLRRFKESTQVVIISGIRRSGKSTLLQQIRRDCERSDYYMNFDDERLINFGVEDFQKLYEVFIELFGVQKTFFFDEIQNVKGWERFVRRLHDYGNKIYITGSNARMLSKELGTHLTGRYIQIDLYPFSFNEFLNFKGIDIDFFSTIKRSEIKRNFNFYLELGGLPEYIISENKEYLKSMYESIIYKDIIVRNKLVNERGVKELAYFAASNIGKEISFNSLKKIIGVKSSTTIKEYYGYLENSFLLFLVPRYEYSLKKQIYANKKGYWIDTALAGIIGFRFSQDRGRFLENIVYIELKRKGKEIFYHKGKKECDFVIRHGLQIVEAIQVCVSLTEEDTRKREIYGLLDALKAYNLKEGLILTEDEENDDVMIEDYKITVLPVCKWLLS